MKVTVEWIDAKKRKPTKKGFYLVETDDHGEAICSLFKDGKWFYTNFRPEKEIEPNVLHWAKKPEIPKYIKHIYMNIIS